jgi:ketosteroid isomerase-like protein
MNETVLELGEAYLDALNRKDLAKIMFLVHPDIHFKMPMTEVSNREGFMMAVRRMLANLRDLQVLSKFSSGNQAMFLYEAHFNEPVGTVKVAELMTVQDDKIRDMEVIFDARPFEKVYGTTTPSELKKAA